LPQPDIIFGYCIIRDLSEPAAVGDVDREKTPGIFSPHQRLQSAGKLKHLPVREFRLDQIAQAHEAVEKGNNATRMVIVMT
jgi:hypothetical protein